LSSQEYHGISQGSYQVLQTVRLWLTTMCY